MRGKSGVKGSAAVVEVFGRLRLMPSKLVAYELLDEVTRLYYQVGPCAYTFEITDPTERLAAATKLRQLFEGASGLDRPPLADYLAREVDPNKPDPKGFVAKMKSTDRSDAKIKVDAPAPRLRK